jgi:Protein of unknown function (DUF3396)
MPSWNEFVLIDNPRLGQDVTLLSPVLGINFYLGSTDAEAVAQLYDEAMKLIQPELTHYIAENMKRPAKITSKALGMIPTWMKRPKDGYAYDWNAYGGTDLGCSGPGLEFFVVYRPFVSAELMRKRLEAATKMSGAGGEIPGYGIRGSIRLMLPVDHPLAEASALSAWLQSLELVRRGAFDAVECSYGLSAWTHLSAEAAQREKAFCSRYPGLDAFRASQAGQVRVDLSYPSLIPLIKRAAWTNVLHELTVRALGGADAIRQQLADTPQIRIVPLEHGLMLQAGERPELGDLNRGDTLPLLRKVARVIRPVRVKLLVENLDDPFWDHFFNIFEKDYT